MDNHVNVENRARRAFLIAGATALAGGRLLADSSDRTYVLRLQNETAFAHPMHLHGHAFRVEARDGRPTRRREWQDTVLVERAETVDISFVADNSGDWMFHCHVLEHQASGMSCFLRVT